MSSISQLRLMFSQSVSGKMSVPKLLQYLYVEQVNLKSLQIHLIALKVRMTRSFEGHDLGTAYKVIRTTAYQALFS